MLRWNLGCLVPPILPLLRYPRENAGKTAESSVCESVAVAAKIRYPDVSFFKDRTKTAMGWVGGQTE